ncbi:unnamed protein product [Closterium sp. NIES-54]
MSASQEEAHGTTAPTAAPVSAKAAVHCRRATVDNTTARRLDVIDLDQVIARVPAHNTPLNANDDTLSYFDAGEVDSDVEDTANEDTNPTMATDRSRWEAHEVMQMAWIRHDYNAQYHDQTRLQGQNRDVMLFEKLRERHPEFRHNLAAVKAKVFRMEAQYRRVGDLLLNDSGKGRPPKIPIFYDIFDRILGDRANARPPALTGSLPGANVSEGLGFESQCVHLGHPSAGGCQRSTGDPRLILGKGYRLVVLGGYGCTDPLLNKPFYPNGLVVGILTTTTATQDAASAAPIRPRARLHTPLRQRTASLPSGSPWNPPLTPPPASRASDDEPTDVAAMASPIRSHVLSAHTRALLRERGVNRRPGPATGSEVNTGNDPGIRFPLIHPTASTNASCMMHNENPSVYLPLLGASSARCRGKKCVPASADRRFHSAIDSAAPLLPRRWCYVAPLRCWRTDGSLRMLRPAIHRQLLRSGVAIFDLDYDAIRFAIYALSASVEGDCYQCVPPDQGKEAAALGAGESSLPGTAPAKALHSPLEQFRQWMDLRKGVAEVLVAVEKLKLKANPQASAVDMAVEGAEDVEEEGLEAATSTEAAGVADTAMTTRATDAVADGSTASVIFATRADTFGEIATSSLMDGLLLKAKRVEEQEEGEEEAVEAVAVAEVVLQV